MTNYSERISFSGVAPTDTPVTLAEAKAQLNVSHTDDDTFIGVLIGAASQYAERVTGRSLIIRSWELLTDFPSGNGPDGSIVLPVSPVVSVTSVTYYDAADDSTVMSSADYIAQAGDYASIYRADGLAWPETSSKRLHPVSVVFTAGYSGTDDSPADLTDIPVAIRQAILLHVAHLYENREAVAVERNVDVEAIPFAYDSLMAPYRVRRF